MMIILKKDSIVIENGAVFLVILFGKLTFVIKLLASDTEPFAVFVRGAFIVVFKIQLHFPYDAVKLACALAFE